MEQHPDPSGPVRLSIEARDEEEIAYHIYLLHQFGLVDAVDARSKTSFAYFPLRLTWRGHEFLDTARDDTIWRKLREKVIEGSGGLAFDVLNAALLAEINQRLVSTRRGSAVAEGGSKSSSNEGIMVA